MSGSQVTQPRLTSETTIKVAKWLRERFGVTNGIPWEEESPAICNRWVEEAEEFLQCFGVQWSSQNMHEVEESDRTTGFDEGIVDPDEVYETPTAQMPVVSRHRMGSAREPFETDEEYEAYVNPPRPATVPKKNKFDEILGKNRRR